MRFSDQIGRIWSITVVTVLDLSWGIYLASEIQNALLLLQVGWFLVQIARWIVGGNWPLNVWAQLVL